MRQVLAAAAVVAMFVPVAAVSQVRTAAPTPALTLSPNCGPAGTTINVTGTGFAPGSTGYPITVTFDPSGTPLGAVQVPASAIDGQGGFSTTLVVPPRASRTAAYSVVANQDLPAGPLSASAPFQLPCRTLVVDPGCGSAGQPVTVTGSGFEPRYPVTITFTPPAGSKPVATATPSADTTFSSVVAVPSLPLGSYVVVADQTLPSAVAVIQITLRAPFTIPCVMAMIVLKPTVGPPGTVTTVTGTGFPVGAVVKLSWNQGIALVSASITVGPTQGFQVQVLIFPHDQLGLRVMSASPDLSVPSAPLFNIATANFLAVPGSEQPRDFAWRN